jgi:hypothetical protein
MPRAFFRSHYGATAAAAAADDDDVINAVQNYGFSAIDVIFQ